MGIEAPQNVQPSEVAPGGQTRPEVAYPNIDHSAPAPAAAPKQETPAVGLPILPPDTAKMQPPQLPAEPVIIHISLGEYDPILYPQAMTVRQGRFEPAWDPRLAAMGMNREEFEATCQSFREVKRQGEPTAPGVLLAILGTIFCCICTICVYCCVVESAKMSSLNNLCSALNTQQAGRGFTWRILTDTAVELKAVPTYTAPASFQVQGAKL